MIILVDGLGFLGFLTILIANGIVCGDLWRHGGLVVLMAYNTVPWMICWYILSPKHSPVPVLRDSTKYTIVLFMASLLFKKPYDRPACFSMASIRHTAARIVGIRK